MIQKPIFIVGLPRSGSTLWLNIIAQNPEISRIGEMLYLMPFKKDFSYFLRKEIGDLSCDTNLKKMLRLIFDCRKKPGITASFWINDIKRARDPKLEDIVFRRLKNSKRNLGDIFKAFTEEVSSFQGYKRYCAKFPLYMNYVPLLKEWYPECKIIHIMRDPRAIVVSRKNYPGDTPVKVKKISSLEPLIRCMTVSYVVMQYIYISKLHNKYKKTMDNYTLFWYEDLLSSPERTIRKMCDFAELDFVPEMLEPKEGQVSSVTGRKQKGFNKDAASHWRNVISPFEERLILLLTQRSMARYEYKS